MVDHRHGADSLGALDWFWRLAFEVGRCPDEDTIPVHHLRLLHVVKMVAVIPPQLLRGVPPEQSSLIAGSEPIPDTFSFSHNPDPHDETTAQEAVGIRVPAAHPSGPPRGDPRRPPRPHTMAPTACRLTLCMPMRVV